jgi:SAM-dependent methyltransferase
LSRCTNLGGDVNRLGSSLKNRVRNDELMDDSSLAEPLHVGALRGLARLNTLSRTAETIWATLKRLEDGRVHQQKPVRVLDLACGGGDITRRLNVLARRDGLPFEFHGCDFSARAVEYARQQSDGLVQPPRFFEYDVLDGPLPPGYSYFVSSLFLHHLSDDQAVNLIAEMARAAERGFLVHDLARSRLGFLLAVAATRMLTRSPVVHVDSLLSVRAAFSKAEMLDFPDRAGLSGARCLSVWPSRLLLSWTAPPAQVG